MATRLKTIEYHVPKLATLPDNTLTAMTSIKLYIPEFSGTVTFKKCEVLVNIKCGATHAIANINSRRIDVSIAGAGATSYTNANAYTNSGEDMAVWHAADCTAHFVSNWTSGTSQTLAISVLCDSAGATVVFKDVEATIFLTYEYDDSQSTHIKTVYIPLDAPVGTLATSKPGTAIDTIPALDTELPETSKTIRNMYIVCEGNVCATASATDGTLSMQIDTLAAEVSASLEYSGASDFWQRFIHSMLYYDSGGNVQGLGMTTNATHLFYVWASVARHNHQQIYMVVTYEFDATGSTDCYVSVKLPMKMAGIIGGTTSSDYTRMKVELIVPEAGITAKRIAAFIFWEQIGAISTLQFRTGTGSFVTYTDQSATLCGSNGCMVRKDDAISLAAGRNVINVDGYRSDAADFGWGLNGYLIVSYTCDKPSGGYGAANHTVQWGTTIAFDGTSTAQAVEKALSGFSISIPETDYFINNVGFFLSFYTDTTGQLTSISSFLENTSGESGVQWVDLINSYCLSDAETGLHQFFNDLTEHFKQWPNDTLVWKDHILSAGLDIETSRRLSMRIFGPATWQRWNFWLTYHAVTYAVAGTVSGSGGGLVVLTAWDITTGLQIGSGSRVGNGSYSITVFYNANNVVVHAYEDGTHVGGSDRTVPA